MPQRVVGPHQIYMSHVMRKQVFESSGPKLATGMKIGIKKGSRGHTISAVNNKGTNQTAQMHMRGLINAFVVPI